MARTRSTSARRAEVRALFQQLLTALGRKQFDAFDALVADDATFDWPYAPLPHWDPAPVGKALFRARNEKGMAESDPYDFKVTALYDQLDPNMLIAEYASDAMNHALKRRYANSYLGILRFRGAKLVYWREYLNPMKIREAYGDSFGL